MKLTTVFLVFTFAACQAKLEEQFFNRKDVIALLDSCPYYIDKKGWKLTSVEQGDPSLVEKSDENFPDRYVVWFLKEEKDTTKYLKIRTTKERIPISILHYAKEYFDRNGKIVVEMSATDTLMWYSENDSSGKEFLIGEYYYKFITHKFKGPELDFYLSHKDSLNKIRGNDLPNLVVDE